MWTETRISGNTNTWHSRRSCTTDLCPRLDEPAPKCSSRLPFQTHFLHTSSVREKIGRHRQTCLQAIIPMAQPTSLCRERSSCRILMLGTTFALYRRYTLLSCYSYYELPLYHIVIVFALGRVIKAITHTFVRYQFQLLLSVIIIILRFTHLFINYRPYTHRRSITGRRGWVVWSQATQSHGFR